MLSASACDEGNSLSQSLFSRKGKAAAPTKARKQKKRDAVLVPITDTEEEKDLTISSPWVCRVTFRFHQPRMMLEWFSARFFRFDGNPRYIPPNHPPPWKTSSFHASLAPSCFLFPLLSSETTTANRREASTPSPAAPPRSTVVEVMTHSRGTSGPLAPLRTRHGKDKGE